MSCTVAPCPCSRINASNASRSPTSCPTPRTTTPSSRVATSGDGRHRSSWRWCVALDRLTAWRKFGRRRGSGSLRSGPDQVPRRVRCRARTGVVVTEKLRHTNRADRRIDANRNRSMTSPTFRALDDPETVRLFRDNWMMTVFRDRVIGLHATPQGFLYAKDQSLAICIPLRPRVETHQRWRRPDREMPVTARPLCDKLRTSTKRGTRDVHRHVATGWARRPRLGAIQGGSFRASARAWGV